MRHQKKTIKLGRTAEHRKALLANQVCSLIEHQRIKTTLAKAKAVRPLAEKMVTLGKKGSLHARRTALATLRQKNACEETVRRNRAAIDQAQRRLHPHRQARPAQERFRVDGVHRMGRCSTSAEEKTAEEKATKPKKEKVVKPKEPAPEPKESAPTPAEESKPKRRGWLGRKSGDEGK